MNDWLWLYLPRSWSLAPTQERLDNAEARDQMAGLRRSRAAILMDTEYLFIARMIGTSVYIHQSLFEGGVIPENTE